MFVVADVVRIGADACCLEFANFSFELDDDPPPLSDVALGCPAAKESCVMLLLRKQRMAVLAYEMVVSSFVRFH